MVPAEDDAFEAREVARRREVGGGMFASRGRDSGIFSLSPSSLSRWIPDEKGSSGRRKVVRVNSIKRQKRNELRVFFWASRGNLCLRGFLRAKFTAVCSRHFSLVYCSPTPTAAFMR